MDLGIASWALANAVLYGICAVPLVPLWIISLSVVSRKGDPARTGFTWLNVVFPFAILGIIPIVAGDAIHMVYYLDYSTRLLYTTYVRVNSVGSAVLRLGDISLLVALAELANGLLFCFDPVKSKSRSAIRYAVLGAALLFAALVVAICAQYNVNFLFFTTSAESVHVDLLGAYFVLYLVSMIAVLGLVCYAMNRAVSSPTLRSSAILLTVASCLNVVRYIWQLAIWATWTRPGDAVPTYETVVDPILYAWPLMVLLVLLFVVGCRKQNGLWSTRQPWSQPAPSNVPPTTMVSGQIYQQQPYSHVQPGWHAQGTPELATQQYHTPMTGELYGSPYAQQLAGSPPPQQLYGSSPAYVPSGPYERHELK